MRHLAIGCMLAIGFAAAVADGTRAQTAAGLFDDTTLHDVYLFINSRDLLKLRAGYLTNTYYPADLLWGTTRVRNVAVRSRGTGSRNPFKLGLRVDFNRFTRNQQFAGLRSLVLDNAWQDAALMRDQLAMAVFRRMGQPAPREAFCRLFINNSYQGVYSMVEPIDGAFAARAFSDPNGYLYEYHWISEFFGGYLGDALEPYKARFEPQTHELESDATHYLPIRDLFREINEPDDPVWRERVEARIDLAQYVTQAAIETFLGENDALLGYAGMNNFYLHRGACGTRFRFLPWDRDLAFTFIDSSVLRATQDNVILARALAYEDLRTLYFDVLEATARSATADDWLLNEVNRRAALITPSVYEDTRKQYSNGQFDEGIEFLRLFAVERALRVLDEVPRVR
jgi:spore coat protein CotH